MWSLYNGRTRLDLSKVRDEFLKIQDGDLTLITPRKNMHDWSKEERFLRSVVVDKDSYVVSCGFPKFGNYGEFLDDTADLNNSLKYGSSVRFSHKEDGSLCIRSVINGNVVMRTRGTLYGGSRGEDGKESFKERFFKIAHKYPKLLDKDWMADRSLLFEYVSPDNVIVVRYDIEDLVFIGFVDHSQLHIGHWDELNQIAEEGQLNLVRLHNLPHEPKKIIEFIDEWEDEGVVARCNEDQVMVKMKSAKYLAKHRLKSNVNYKFVAAIFGNLEDKNIDVFIEVMKGLDFDYETIQETLPFYYRCEKVEAYYLRRLRDVKDVISYNKNNGITDEKENRKVLTLSMKDLKGPVRSLLFAVYDNNLETINKVYIKMLNEEITE